MFYLQVIIIMKEEMLRMMSNTKANMKGESSDSNCSIVNNISHPNKRCRVERFKGIVPQQNGHWGAQIYANHHRIWLGTFKSELDAAMAYDSAAIKLRSGDNSHRNFPSTKITLLELKFQSRFSIDVILRRIRDGSYPSKLADFLRNQQIDDQIEIGLNLSSSNINGDDGGFSCTLLFQKELTPSDVGKLNRLVIPKRYAVKHFPNIPDPNSDAQRVHLDEVQLEFYDRQMRLWKFRYCYWKSSQSFVFTRGWNRFVKEKRLRANDTIAFYMYESECGRSLGKSFLVIDHVALKSNDNNHPEEVKDEKAGLADCKTFVEMLGSNDDTKGFRLFGVKIH